MDGKVRFVAIEEVSRYKKRLVLVLGKRVF